MLICTFKDFIFSLIKSTTETTKTFKWDWDALLKWSIWVILDFIYSSLSSEDFYYIFIYLPETKYPELRADWNIWKYTFILQHAGDFFEELCIDSVTYE